MVHPLENSLHKVSPFKGLTCQVHERVPHDEHCDRARGSVIFSLHTLSCNPDDRGECCARYLAKYLAFGPCQSA